MDYKSYVYKQPPVLPDAAIRELLEMRKVESTKDRSDLFRPFLLTYENEIADREKIQRYNSSNFMWLCSQLDDLKDNEEKKVEVRSVLKTYDGMPGYFYRPEGDGKWLKEHQRRGKPHILHAVLNHFNSMKLYNEGEELKNI